MRWWYEEGIPIECLLFFLDKATCHSCTCCEFLACFVCGVFLLYFSHRNWAADINTYSARPENTRGTLHVRYVPGPKILGDKFPTSNCQPRVYSFAHDRWYDYNFLLLTAVSLLKQANISIYTYFSFFSILNKIVLMSCVLNKRTFSFVVCFVVICVHHFFFSSAALTHYVVHSWTFPKRTL